jgi:predicted HNH restriction endonuclease
LKRDGKRYCEVHHLFHLSGDPPSECLAPDYLVVLCANCHRRMHYARVSDPVRIDGGWSIKVDDEPVYFVTC